MNSNRYTRIILALCTLVCSPVIAADKEKKKPVTVHRQPAATAATTQAAPTPAATPQATPAPLPAVTAPTPAAATAELSSTVAAALAATTSTIASESSSSTTSALSTPATTTAPSSPALTSTMATSTYSSRDMTPSETALTPIDSIQPRSAFASLFSLGQGILPAALVDSVLSCATDEEQLRQFAVYGKLETLDKEKLIKHFNGALARLSVKAKNEHKNYPPLRIAQMIQLGRERHAVCEVQTVLDLEAQLARYSHACSAAQEQLSLLKKDMVGQLQKTKDQLTDKS